MRFHILGSSVLHTCTLHKLIHVTLEVQIGLCHISLLFLRTFVYLFRTLSVLLQCVSQSQVWLSTAESLSTVPCSLHSALSSLSLKTEQTSLRNWKWQVLSSSSLLPTESGCTCRATSRWLCWPCPSAVKVCEAAEPCWAWGQCEPQLTLRPLKGRGFVHLSQSVTQNLVHTKFIISS